jgi:3-hydroxyisobutyrate dehydrogenase-like beta-hydroxyacid dehydrogenase
VYVDMSTVSPRASRGVADQVRVRGAEMLDAPVSGSIPQAESGTLAIMVRGDEQAFRQVEPLLRELGQTVTRIGESGQGLVLKLAINISLAVQVLAFSEGLLLAERAGVESRLAAEVMSACPIGSPMLKARVPLLLDLPKPGSTLRWRIRTCASRWLWRMGSRLRSRPPPSRTRCPPRPVSSATAIATSPPSIPSSPTWPRHETGHGAKAPNRCP